MKQTQTQKQLRAALCTNHSGKMEGMISMSSSVLRNPYCQQRRLAAEKAYRIACRSGQDPQQITDIICRHCYAENLLEYRTTAADKYARNTELLTARVYAVEDFPAVNAIAGRIEAFGDVQPQEPGITQARNYIHWTMRNPMTSFAAWTKNLAEWHAAITIEGKPSNLRMIYSVPAINAAGIADPEAFLEALQVVYPWLDALFIVYDKQHAAGVEINCGARHCLSCLRCYTGSDRIIRELLK